MQTIGIIGGTFDPIHHGHIRPALEVAEHFGLARLLLMPLAVAVHRQQPRASAEQRLAMCRLAASAASSSTASASSPQPLLEVDDREIHRGGQSYSVLTLEELHREYDGQTAFCWLMGQDAFNGFQQWKDWPRILQLAHIVVMQRPGYQWRQAADAALLPYYADSLRGNAGCIVFKTVQPQAISSTEIRRKLGNGDNVQGLLAENVRNYALEQQIYSQTREPHDT